MNNNDVLRRLRYAFDLSDQEVIDLFGTGGMTVTRQLISDLLKKDDDPAHLPCSVPELASFLNGFIIARRGLREGESGPPSPETELSNNEILRKLKIALRLNEGEMHELMALAGMPLSRPELSALFRSRSHQHYRECQDQILRNFLKGLQLKYRSEPPSPETAARENESPSASRAIDLDPFLALEGFLPRPELERAFERDGIQGPSEPQRLAFAPILRGKNVVLESGTGTGKTLAYLLPLLQRLEADPESRVVCLAPAAELAVQTLNVANRYKPAALSVGALVSGGNQRKQKDRIQKSTRLIAGTPGRVLEAVAQRQLKGVTTYVLDEPEGILGSKDAEFLLEVLSRPPRPQIIVVGATFGLNSERLVSSLMGEDVVRLTAAENPLAERIVHYRMKVRDAGNRDLQLIRFFEQKSEERAIVYVNQPHLIRHLFRLLNDSNIPAVTLSQDRTKQQCEQALREFSRGEVQALITTDRAATGIDIPEVPWVVHYEPARSPQGYVHRAGRTARAGRTGQSLSLITDSERFILRELESSLGIPFEDFRI